jgi:hypothetical protein
MPPVVPMFAKGKKWERILAMSPLFRIGKIKIKKDHADFIQEWVDYDSAQQKPKDDCLDSMEIALRTAGALLDAMAEPFKASNPGNLPDWIVNDRPSDVSKEDRFVDEMMGSMW